MPTSPSLEHVRSGAVPAVPCRMPRPWETHLCAALVLASIAFAVGELWRAEAGAAIGAAAVFVALRPLFRNRGPGK